MDAAPLIDPQCTCLQIDGHDGLVTDLDQDREHDIPPDQDGWRALGECIGGHQNLRELEFREINSNPENLQALLMGVSHNRSVRDLGFGGFDGDWSLEVLGTFFENNQNLSSLQVWDSNPSHESVRSLSTVFQSCAACSLEEITWCNSSVGDAIISEFIASLAGLSRLKKLELRSSNIERRGCDAVAALLRNPSCTLQTIDLSWNSIGDMGLAALESGVAVNGTLKCLKLKNIRAITPAAWISFANILRNPGCILEELYLTNNIINDVMVAFADALSGNNTLKRIKFGHRSTISNVGWSAISRVLFGQSSIIDMYSSNHTLSNIDGPMWPTDVGSYLRLNENDDKHAVARQKILMHFFVGNFNMEPFNENNMNSKVLPHLLSWMGRVSNGKSYSALFSFLRRAPTLCENCVVETQHQEAEG